MSDYTEFQIFAIFYIIGIIITFVFDFFKSLRIIIKHNNKAVFIEDFIYIIFTTVLFFIGIFKLNNGIIRFYLILATMLGMFAYSLTISRFCVIIFTVIIGGLNKIITFILNVIQNILLNIKRIIRFFIEYFIRRNKS